MRAGKVIYPAVSNWSAWQTQRAVDIQERRNWARLQVIQPMYSLVKRQAEVEILPMAEANGIGVIPYSPAAAGLLSGKYFGQASGRLKTNKMYEARYSEAWVFEVGGEVCRLLQGARPASGQHGDRLGRRASRDHRADHRRAQHSTSSKDSLASVEVDMTSGAARRDRRPLAHAAAGHRSAGGAEDRAGLVFSGGAPLQWRVMSYSGPRASRPLIIMRRAGRPRSES